MEMSHYDSDLNNHYGRDNFKIGKKKKVVNVQTPATGGLPAVATINGQVMVKTGKKKKGIFKKIGAVTKKAVKATGKGVAKGVKGVGKASKKVIKAASLAPLVPLMPVMGLALTKKGFAAPKKVEDRAQAFYNHIVTKSTYEKEIHFDGYNDDHLAADIVISIVSYVKDLIQKKKAKNNGAVDVELSPVEESIVNGTEKVVAKIETEAKDAGVPQQEIKEKLPTSNSNDNEGGAQLTNSAKAESEGKQERKKSRRKEGSELSGMQIAGFSAPLVVAAGVGIYLLAKKA